MKNSLMKHKFKRLRRKLKNLSKDNKNFYVWIGFFIFGLILLVNIGFMTIYLINNDYQYRVIDHAYVDVVLPNQEIDTTLQLGIVKIEETSLAELKVGDSVVVYSDFKIDVYWVETIVSIDASAKEVTVTYDNVSTETFSEDDILGIYVEDADFFGTIYYSASYLRGFIFLTITHGIILYGFYYIFLAKKETIM